MSAFADFLVERMPVLQQEWNARREALLPPGVCRRHLSAEEGIDRDWRTGIGDRGGRHVQVVRGDGGA